jgi:hypothetical protein
VEKAGAKCYYDPEEILDMIGTVSPHHGPRREYPEGTRGGKRAINAV